jgi:molybdopterin synthase catalytic subunit
MQVNVLLFATLKDGAGTNRLSVTVGDPATVRDVRAALTQRFPAIERNLKAAIASVNREYAQDGDAVGEGDEIAFFPPVSGGSGDPHGGSYPEIFQLAGGPVDHDAVVASITTPGTGAVCLFSGMVRGETARDGHLPQTQHLEYEGYEPMALEKMGQVAREIRQRWPLVQGIAIIQRIGRLSVGQNTVLIACSSGHRDEGCFEAARYGIDRLKEIVPVWKREVGGDGAVWIEGEYMPTESDRAD